MPLYSLGVVYCGYSSKYFPESIGENDSYIVALSFKTPRTNLVTASVINMAGISPPVKIKSQIEIVVSTNVLTRSSTPS